MIYKRLLNSIVFMFFFNAHPQVYASTVAISDDALKNIQRTHLCLPQTTAKRCGVTR
jgi:hypothetical protein